ncbi:flagellin [Ectothiorhodospira shaposhnikovii]|uniref:flagellin N-terminal helical domain-containing protein n=1 Tax=Ectothiorhodospira shaposhnikovii TaxID=1054 RepID=UPI001EE8790E|nr:flagellin [Ectothiorhodospira shaposhnikovii]MCG5513019.1 flagellin FliC [Ectothiorhodospira shaposhnikovii]
MAQVINTNVSSLNAQRNLNNTQAQLQTSLQRLSSGMRINSAKDDAAGLAISERFTAQIRGLNQAARNANDGISLVQTAEGGLSEISNNLQRMRELAVQAASGTYTDAEDRAAMDAEYQALADEIGRIATDVTFNDVDLFDGSLDVDIQVGANSGQVINIALADDFTGLAFGDLTDVANANTELDALDGFIDQVASARADLGAIQNRLESAVATLNNTSENLSAARSRIMDADFAAETAELTRTQILQQAGVSVLAQANTAPQSVLALLQ